MDSLTEVEDKLRDLHSRDPLLPPYLHAASALEVIPVHHDVHRQIQGDRHP